MKYVMNCIILVYFVMYRHLSSCLSTFKIRAPKFLSNEYEASLYVTVTFWAFWVFIIKITQRVG